MGFPMSKNSPYKALIDNVILSTINSDVIDEIKASWFDRNICQPTFLVTTKIQLSIKTFGGLIVILAVTIAAMLISLYPERIWEKHFHQKLKTLLRKWSVK